MDTRDAAAPSVASPSPAPPPAVERKPYTEEEVKTWIYGQLRRLAETSGSALLVDEDVGGGTQQPAATRDVDLEALMEPNTPAVLGVSLAHIVAPDPPAAFQRVIDRRFGSSTEDFVRSIPAIAQRRMAEYCKKQMPQYERAIKALETSKKILLGRGDGDTTVGEEERRNVMRTLDAVTTMLTRTPVELIGADANRHVVSAATAHADDAAVMASADVAEATAHAAAMRDAKVRAKAEADSAVAEAEEAKAGGDVKATELAAAATAAKATAEAAANAAAEAAANVAAVVERAKLERKFALLEKALEASMAELKSDALVKQALTEDAVFCITVDARAALVKCFRPFMVPAARKHYDPAGGPLSLPHFVPNKIGEGRGINGKSSHKRPAHYVPEHPDDKWPSLATRARIRVRGARVQLVGLDGVCHDNTDEIAREIMFDAAQSWSTSLPYPVIQEIVLAQLSAVKASYLEVAFAETGADLESPRAYAMFPRIKKAAAATTTTTDAEDWTERLLRHAVIEASVTFVSVGSGDTADTVFGDVFFDLFVRMRPVAMLSGDKRALVQADALGSYQRFVTNTMKGMRRLRDERIERDAAEFERKKAMAEAAAAASPSSPGSAETAGASPPPPAPSV